MKKVVVMTTGGTIAMKYDPVTQGLIPAVSGDDLIEAVPALREIAEVEVVEFSNVPSGHITPQMMFDLAKMADRYAEREDVSGIVVTHGTDTLEETAYMLGLAVKTNKPVCLTGAMRGASETGPDGPANILAAVMVAASDEALGKGALLIFNDEIHAAAEVTKTHDLGKGAMLEQFFSVFAFWVQRMASLIRLIGNRLEKEGAYGQTADKLLHGAANAGVCAGRGRIGHHLSLRQPRGAENCGDD